MIRPIVLKMKKLDIDTLKNAIKWLDIDLIQAVKLLTKNPAGVIGMGDRKGLLKAGYDADFLILDNDLEVIQTWINGNCFFKRK